MAVAVAVVDEEMAVAVVAKLVLAAAETEVPVETVAADEETVVDFEENEKTALEDLIEHQEVATEIVQVPEEHPKGHHPKGDLVQKEEAVAPIEILPQKHKAKEEEVELVTLVS